MSHALAKKMSCATDSKGEGSSARKTPEEASQFRGGITKLIPRPLSSELTALRNGIRREGHAMMCGRDSGPWEQKGQTPRSDLLLWNLVPVVQANARVRRIRLEKKGEPQLLIR